MKLKNRDVDLLENLIDAREFEITPNFVKYCYHNTKPNNHIRLISNKRKRQNLFSRQYEYTRRTLLKLKYKRNNSSAKNIREGFVYAIVNPSYPDYVKIGSAIDVYDRLNSYQTSSPFRDYELLIYFFSEDRLKTEKEIHNMFERNGEWCKVEREHIVNIFRLYRKNNTIK